MSLVQELQKQKKGFMWKKILMIAILMGGGYFAYTTYFSNSDKPEEKQTIKTYTVKKGDIKLSISGEGKITKLEGVNLNFPINGTIKDIYVKEGDRVITGQVLAKLDDSELKNKLEQANIALKNEQAQLQAKINALSPKELEVYKQQYEQAKLNYEIVKSQTDMDVKNAYLLLQSAKNDYNSAKKISKLDENNALTSLKSAQVDLQTTKENLLNTKKQENEKLLNLEKDAILKIQIAIPYFVQDIYNVDKLIGITDANKNFNDGFEAHLGAKNTSLKEKIKSEFIQINKRYDDLKSISVNNNNVEKYLPLFILLGEDISRMLEDTLDVLKVSVLSRTLTQQMIDSYIQDFQKYINDTKTQINNLEQAQQEISRQKLDMESKISILENQVKSFQSKLESEKTNLDKIRQTSSISVENLKFKLDLSQQQYENALIKQKTSLELAQKQIDSSWVNYQAKLSGPTREQLAPYYVSIENAKNQIKQVKEDLQNSVLRSPSAGTVLDIYANVGENVSSNNSFIKISVGGENFITSYIEEGDIAKVFSGQKAYVSVDAIDSLTFTGKIIFVSNKGEEDSNGIVTYKVLIKFNTNNPKVKDGMSVSLDFITKEAKNVLVIPVEAVKTYNGKPAVLLSNGEWKNIITQLTDNKIVEVISGLKVGDKIVY